MPQSKIYQLGMECRYAAFVMQQWIEEDMPCDITVKKAKTEGLIIVELTNAELANNILTRTNCKVHIKNSKY